MRGITKISFIIVLFCLMLSCTLLTGCETINTLKEKLEEMSQNNGSSVDDDNLSDGDQNDDTDGDDIHINGSCTHSLKKLDWVVPTCIAEGKRGAFQCKLCGKIFEYSAEKDGLVEVKEQSSIPKKDHTVSNKYGIRLKSGVSKATSFSDYEIVTVCNTCGTGFAVEESDLRPFTPSTKVLYDDVTPVSFTRDTVDGLVSTTYIFPSSTKVGIHNWVYHNNDSGKLDANTKVPFSANTDRYILMMVKNNSGEKVTFKYGAEYYSTYCWSEPVTVEGGEYQAFVLKLNFSGSDYACYHTIQLLDSISNDVSLTFSGFYVN